MQQLATFLRSAAKMNTDKDVATYLAGVKLSERLDDRTVEELQGLGIGPRALKALFKLRDESKGLPAAAPLPPPPPKPAPKPPPSSEEQGAIIDEVRNYALNYSKNLPDFICAQVSTRKVAPLPGGKYSRYASSGGDPAWQTMDKLTLRLSYFEQKENYKLILRNNTPVTQDYEKIGGPKSFGDFGSLMREVFEPSSEARFDWDHWGVLRERPVMAFAYHVPQNRSQYRLVVEDLGKSIIAGYRGLVEVDTETHVVMRVTVIAQDVPADFPIREAETILDYGYQDLSGHSFLLPLKAQIQMRGADVLNRIEEEFRLYRKYSAESELKFDTEPLPPSPDEKPRPPAAPRKP